MYQVEQKNKNFQQLSSFVNLFCEPRLWTTLQNHPQTLLWTSYFLELYM